ncbi:MAG: gliding motility protein [Oligoflexia bacterium]|nr:gliding motility protein [Oligoflexia bacterium]
MFKKLKHKLHKIRLVIDPHARKKELSYILDNAKSETTLLERIIWLESLVDWIRASTQLPTEFETSTGQFQNARIRFLLQVLDRHHDWKKTVSENFRAILEETSGVQLFCQTGLVQEKGFFSEAATRILKVILPTPPHDKDLAELFNQIFKHKDDAAWITSLSPDVLNQIIALINFEALQSEDIFMNLKYSMTEALLILGSNNASLGLSHEIRQRLPQSFRIVQSPFILLNQSLVETVKNMHTMPDGPEILQLADRSHKHIENCRQLILGVFDQLEKSGVSVHLVYNLETLLDSLNRIDKLLKLLVTNSTSNSMSLVISFMADLAHQSAMNRTLSDLIYSNLHLLSRKIIERTGDSGEHYITKTKSEYFHMLLSAMGGGLLTVGTTVFKFGINKLKLPLFFEGLFSWINYSGSFILMQTFQFTLATKQPSMTASALAGKLTQLQDSQKVDEFIDEVARITRSQFAAILGNLGLVIPGAIAVDFLNVQLAGNHIINYEYANYVLESLHPYKSFTIPLAALTGALLWLSSMASGWLENWIVYRQLPAAISRHRRLTELFGEKTCQRLSHWFSYNVAAFGSNVSLGFLLAFTPIIGRFFGLPLDVRHVTLSTGAMTFAVCSLYDSRLPYTSLTWALVGIFFVGILNFGVSFALALGVAVRARNVNQSRFKQLLKASLKRIRQNPGQFLLPPKF